MTAQANENMGAALAWQADGATVTINGCEITVPKGTLVIRAAELLGIEIPRFCDHPLLDPASLPPRLRLDLGIVRPARPVHACGFRERTDELPYVAEGHLRLVAGSRGEAAAQRAIFPSP